ncbi:MAG: SpoVG family protein [Lachnospiraceae bacterium]|nr:SpoVG family protein [Lachnospiraceae bacterium]
MTKKGVKGEAVGPNETAAAVQDAQEVKREGQAAEAKPKYEVRFGTFPSTGAVKGVCSVTIGGEFAVKNVRLVEGSNGLFVAMPSYKSGDEYRDIFFPVTKEARQALQEAVIGEYELQMQIHSSDASYGASRAQNEAPEGIPMTAVQ